MENSFRGPLFIVGLSRSGTKLIRDMLNRNDSILIPEIETHFIPKILAKKDNNIKESYNIIKESSFVQRFPDIVVPSIEELNKIIEIKNTTDLVESVLKYYALKGSIQWDENIIWGDKTPLYLRHLEILTAFFPACKIIHIIRDPRDRALSVKRTWNKSIYRATEKWRNEIENSMKWKNRKKMYLQIKYEDYINEPEELLKEICLFLDISFSDKMLKLSKPSEKHGENKKNLVVNKNNESKYHVLKAKRIKRIEEIAFPLMNKLGYDVKYAERFKRVSPVVMFTLKFTDFINFKISNRIKGY